MPKTARKPKCSTFASRVLVYSLGGLYMYRTHAEEAQRLCRSRAAEPVDKHEKQVTKIHLLRKPFRSARGSTTGNALQRPKESYKERLLGLKSNTWALKRIPKSDRWSLNVAIKENTTKPKEVRQ